MNPIKNNPLGRGLGTLIPRNPLTAQTETADAANINKKFLEVDIADICPNDSQPRRYFEEEGLLSLAESISGKGVIQPLVVAKTDGQGKAKYMLIAGERRWRAAGLAGLKNIPVVLIERPTETERLELALIENTQRDDLTPLELAQAYRSLMDKCGYGQEDVARIVGKSRSAVANTLRLLSLPASIMEALESKMISEGHARSFLSLDETQQAKLLNAIINRSLSVRRTEALAKKLQKGEKAVPSPEQDPNFEALIKEMECFFGSKIKLKSRNKNINRGIIEIRYESLDDLDRIISKLRSSR